jgi:hypothetical protein
MIRQMLKNLATDFEFLNHGLIDIYFISGVASLEPYLKNVVECLTGYFILLVVQVLFIRDFVSLGINRKISKSARTGNSLSPTFALSKQIYQRVAFIRECLSQRSVLICD